MSLNLALAGSDWLANVLESLAAQPTYLNVAIAGWLANVRAVRPGSRPRAREHAPVHSLSPFPARLACPARKAVTGGRLKRGAGASAQRRAAPTAPPPPGRSERHRGAKQP